MEPPGVNLRGGGGIIPAYAGSTIWVEGLRGRPADHPRIRGEHRTPRGGTRILRRIIPAYAGSTGRRRSCESRRRDHPRIRGEHSALLQSVAGYQGSSPHTRGALLDGDDPYRAVRIIPAYAGSTSETNLSFSRRSDHPRIRGEHAGARAYTPSRPGSSPHTRGALTFRPAIW